ncbi:reverse transcriptase domain-containing protein, partial [Tanacetum coccineum]
MLGKKPVPQDMEQVIFDEALREYCDRDIIRFANHSLRKYNQEEKEHPSKEGASRKGSDQDMSATDPEVLSQGMTAPNLLRKRVRKEKQCSKESASERRYTKRASSRRTEELSESEGSAGGHWKSKLKRQKSSIEDDLSQPWVCEETDPFTPRIRYFDFPKTRMPSHIKTYDGSEDPEDHLKIFQSAAKTERWAMPTWCHMFNSTLTGNARVWFDDLPKETIDSYDDLKKAFLENYLQQKKCIKDPVEIHNIRQRDGESTEEFVRRYKLECRDVKGAPECMKISGFMHGITNPELIKRLHDKIPKSVDEMMRVTTAFLRGEVAASNRERKKPFSSWKQQEANQKQNFKKGGYRNQQRSERKQDRFSLLTKTPKEIFALDKGKFKAPPPMTTPVEKRNHAKFCEFHGEVGHNTDECMHLKKQIEEMLKAGKLSHLIKELKQNNGKEQPKVTKKGETSGKDKALAILMVQPWERVARQRITQSFSPNPEIFFPPLGEDEGTEGPMIIEAEIGGHCVHRMYVDGGSASEILYEHCFNRLRPEIRKQLIPATTPLIGFSGEIIWLIGQIQLLVKIGDEEHSASAWMNFMVVRSSSPYNGIIGRPEVRKLQEVPSTAHGMLKILKPANMTGVPRHIEKHRLNVREGCSSVRQKKRGQAADRNQAIQEEVGKLVETGIMKEVHYHDWLSNPEMVKKHDNSWRMCVDFKDLNKACPKNGYPLPEIDWKVESLCGFPFKCFLDAYKGYHQIQMAKEDEEKTAFITSQGIFCYTKMPFGLRNAGATYQRLVDKAFHKALRDPELNYTLMEKVVLALVHASKRLKKPKVLVKEQILANFIGKRPEEDSPDTLMEEEEELSKPWILFDATNNEAEYEALIAGLRIAEQMGVKNLQANVDSR